jgi:hypothetical protein
MVTNTELISFTVKRLFYNSEGRKVFDTIPKGWRKIKRNNMKSYQHESHKVHCVPTGKANDILIIDFDKWSKEEFLNILNEKAPGAFETARMVQTPRGFHLYCKYREGVPGSTGLGPEGNIDIRNDGNFVVAPPSVTCDNKQYTLLQEGRLDCEVPDEFWKYLYEPKHGENWRKYLDKQPEQPPPINRDITDVDDQELALHLKNIHRRFLAGGDYNTWRNIGWSVLDSFEDKELGWQLFSQASERADPVSFKKGIEHLRENHSPGRFTAGTIKYYSKESDRTKYYGIIQAMKPRIWGNHADAAEDFIGLRQDTIFMCNQHIYLYQKNEWEREDPKNSIVMRALANDLKGFYQVAVDAAAKELEQHEVGTDPYKEALSDFDYKSKQHKRIGDYTQINNIYKFLRCVLIANNELLFDTDPKQDDWLHYKNGKLNLHTREFCKRDITDLVSQRIGYDYSSAVDPEVYEEIVSIFKKFEPDAELRKYLMEWFFLSLTGNTDNQKFMHFYGPSASNGKSAMMKMFHAAFGPYVTDLDRRVLMNDCDNRDKFIQSLATGAARLAYVEELGNKKIDVSFIKRLVDGEVIQYKEMYGTTKYLTVKFKLTNCSNFELSADFDEGIQRRAMIFQCRSQFINDESMSCPGDWSGDDWERRLFRIDVDLPKKINQAAYKLALVKYLMKFPCKRICVPKKIREETIDSLKSCDNWRSEIEEAFEITKDESDRVPKSLVLSALVDIRGSMSKQQFNKKLKTYGIKYEAKKRAHPGDPQGCYTGLIELTEEAE